MDLQTTLDMSLNESTPDWPFAIITLINRRDGLIFSYPAAFVYDVPGGFAWVDPSYLDGFEGGATAVHILRGAVLPDLSVGEPRSRYVFENDDFTGKIGMHIGKAEHQADSLAWYAAELRRRGKTHAGERERVWGLIAPGIPCTKG
ncbi:hypothetical protein [Cupriavidus necator]|uniref:Uncharacterized protein n=1 Tax=Cupriavidus pinatubonensis (strain JMP 134 / LMG 1197) TaxID=264198 RepID=Q46MH4_CUPPJ|nr:hypothetical protein [Cupriavidus necator]